jgi:hypothetical protein
MTLPALRLEPAPRPAPAAFVLTLWTDDPSLAALAEQAGVDRVGLDLERLGKVERQGSGGSFWLSPHRESALAKIRPMLRRARLFVRTNPPHSGWREEVERLLAQGARVLMLPAFRDVGDVARAADIVAGRAELVPLIETVPALAQAEAIASLPGVGELHFGLNDLSLALGISQRFRLLVDDRLEAAARSAIRAGARIGLGGIARHEDARLPVPPDLVYAQHARLGSRAALIARSFLGGLGKEPADLLVAIAAARRRLDWWAARSETQLAAARDAYAAALERAE